jgi:hypothetical protein
VGNLSAGEAAGSRSPAKPAQQEGFSGPLNLWLVGLSLSSAQSAAAPALPSESCESAATPRNTLTGDLACGALGCPASTPGNTNQP